MRKRERGKYIKPRFSVWKCEDKSENRVIRKHKTEKKSVKLKDEFKRLIKSMKL